MVHSAKSANVPLSGNDVQQRVVKRPSIGINMGRLFLKRGAVHGCRCQDGWACSTVEQGQATRSEAALEAERDLGDPGSLATRKTSPRLALFNLVIDSKLRGCDLVGLRVHDVVHGSRVAARAIVVQKKTERPVQFEITEQTRDAIAAGITAAHKGHADLPSDHRPTPGGRCRRGIFW